MNNKTYTYKRFSQGNYLGILTTVISEFQLNQQINTAGAQLEIELAVAFQEAGASLTTSLLIDESANLIATESNENIILDTAVTITNIPSLGDKIEVWEYSDEDPTGSIVFSGLVSKFSSSYLGNSTKLTLLNYGVYLDNFIIQILPQQTLVEALSTDSASAIYGTTKAPIYSRDTGIAQTFTVPATTNVTSIYLKLFNMGTFDVTAQLDIYLGTPSAPGALVGTVSRTIIANATVATEYLFQFSTAITLTSATNYFMLITNPFGSNSSDTNVINLAYNTTSSYANGDRYVLNETTGYGLASGDIYFRILSATGGVGNQYFSTDPSDIFKSLITNFNALGGIPAYSASSVEQSNTLVSYTFKFNTYLEGVKKVIELAPANWWWSVDPGTNLISFKSLGQTPNHTFVLGTHIQDLELTYSLEQLINTVYFSGGDTGGGVNLLVTSIDATSVGLYGAWLDKPVDNRVTNLTTGQILADNEVAQFKDPRFATTITILSTSYNTSSIKVGQIVGFANTNSLVDSLVLQVMARRYNPASVELTLAILPPTQSKRIEDIKRNLGQEQTVNNPA